MRGPHIDLHHVNPFGLGLGDQLGVGLHVGVVDHDDRGFLCDQRGKGLGAGIGVPVGVTHHHFHASRFELFFQALVPADGQVKAIGHRDECDRFACERLFVALAERLV